MSDEAAEGRLATYRALLDRWAPTINLTARGEDITHRHINDSMQLAPFVTGGLTVDVGSGAGFPGLVLAIVTGHHVHLVESDQRKAAFLVEAVRLTSAPATVHAVRVEAFSPAPVDLLVARAFAPLNRLLTITRHLIAPTTRLALLKGCHVAAEIADAVSDWMFDTDLRLSAMTGGGSVLVLDNVRPRPIEC